MEVGIVGLPYSGKTALFEAITGAHGSAIEHTPAAHVATVTVPDDRIDFIARTSSPKKVTKTHIDFVDVAGVTSDQDRARTVQILTPLHGVDGLVHVVRYFEWPSAPPHPRGSLDPARDVKEMETELILADLDTVERRIKKLEKQVIRATPTQEQDRKELALMRRLSEVLDAGQQVTTADLSAEESFLLRSFQLLGAKPILTVLNVHEDEIQSDATQTAAASLGPDTVVISAKIEKEIAELDPEERPEFIEALGLGEPAAERVIQACYRSLGLRSFFTGTTPGEELRAWTVTSGDTALVAAGRIHSDMARGFIRAEVIAFEDVQAAGSVKEARTHGKMRLEGKDYEVQDGEVIHFRFKV